MSSAAGARFLVGEGMGTLAIEAGARAAPCLVLTCRMYLQLADELGGEEAAAAWLLALSESVGKPIGVNFNDGPDRSQTCFVAPRSWTEEKLKGWIGGHHAELEAMFGEVSGPLYRPEQCERTSTNRAERRRRAKGV